MDMSLTELRVAGVLGFVVVGLIPTVGAVVVSLLVAGAVQAGLRVAGWLGSIRSRAAEGRSDVATATEMPVVPRSLRLERPAEHSLLARQAWWRLRC
jgi:hypothetical protein